MQSHNCLRHITLSHNGIHSAQSIILSETCQNKTTVPSVLCISTPPCEDARTRTTADTGNFFYVTEWQHDIHRIAICKGELLLRITEVLVVASYCATKNMWKGCQACSSR